MAKQPMLTDPGLRADRRAQGKPKRLTYGTPPKKKVRPKGSRPRRQAQRQQPAQQPGMDPLQPLSGRAFNQEVNAQTRLQYGPQERELGYQRQVQAQRQANVPGWFQDYRDTLGVIKSQTQQAYKAGQDAAYTQANQMFGQQQGAITQQGQQAQADAAMRGTTADTSVQTQALQGAAQNQAMGTAFGGMIGAQGANQQTIMAGEQQRAAGQQLQAQQNEAAEMAKLGQIAAELESDKGQFRIKARGQLREQERQYANERALLGLNVAKEENDQASEARRLRLELKKLRALNRDRLNDNQLAAQREGRLTGADKRNADKDAYQRGQGLGPYKPSAGKGGTSVFSPKDVKKNRAKLRNFVALGRSKEDLPSGYDPLMAKVAAQLIKVGAVDRKTSKRFREAYGFSPRTLGKHPKAKIKRRAGRRGGEQFSPNS